MILMTALGIGMFLGFNMEWVSINENTFRFFDETAFADYRILSEDGFTAEDADRVAGIEGVDAVSRYISVNADLKIYLTATADCRAKRRYDELTAKGEKCDFEEIRKDIIARDHNDMTRAISPLCKAEDAIEVDTSEMNVEEVTQTIIALFNAATESGNQ